MKVRLNKDCQIIGKATKHSFQEWMKMSPVLATIIKKVTIQSTLMESAIARLTNRSSAEPSFKISLNKATSNQLLNIDQAPQQPRIKEDLRRKNLVRKEDFWSQRIRLTNQKWLTLKLTELHHWKTVRRALLLLGLNKTKTMLWKDLSAPPGTSNSTNRTRINKIESQVQIC